VTAGTSAIKGWTVAWTFLDGQVVSQLWSGAVTRNGSRVTVSNAAYNGALAVGASTTFGFTGTVTGTANNPPAQLTVTTS